MKKRILLVLLTISLSIASVWAYTAQFHAGIGTYNGQSDFSITEASNGSGVTLPTPALSGCAGWEFAGWILGSTPYALNEEMVQTLYKGGTVYSLSSVSEDFTAVYRYKSNHYCEVYVNDQLSDGEQYLIINTDEHNALYVNTSENNNIWSYSLENTYNTWSSGYVVFGDPLGAAYRTAIPVVLEERNSANHYWSLYNPEKKKYADFRYMEWVSSYNTDANCTITRTFWNTFSLKGVNSNTILGQDNIQTGSFWLLFTFPLYDLNSDDFYIYRRQTYYSSTPECNLPTYTVTLNPGANGQIDDNELSATVVERENDYHQGVELPAATPNTGSFACTNQWEFAGWTESGSIWADSSGITKRLWLAGERYYPKKDETLHAVYRRITHEWEQVTNPNSLQAGEKLLIAYEMTTGFYVLSAEESEAGYNASIAVGTGEILALNNAAAVWQLEGTAGAWRLKDKNDKHLDLTLNDCAYSYTYPWSRWSDEFTITGETNLSIRSNYGAKRYLTANAAKFLSTGTQDSNIRIFRQVTTYSKTPKCETYTVLFNSGEGTFGTGTQKDSTVVLENISSAKGLPLDSAAVPKPKAPTCVGDSWEFAGWRVGSGLNATTDAPGVLYTEDDPYIPMQDSVTLYAVYRNGANGVYYERIQYATEVVRGGVYVIATTGNIAVKTSLRYTNYFEKYSSITVDNTTHRIAGNVPAEIQWQFDGTRFKAGNNSYYLSYNGSTNYYYFVENNSSPFQLRENGQTSYLAEKSHKEGGVLGFGGTTYYDFGAANSSQDFYIYKQKSLAPHNSWPHCTPFELILYSCGGMFSSIGDTHTPKEPDAGEGVSLNTHRPTSDCDGWTLEGWVEKEAVQARNSAPVGMIAPNAKYVPKQDKDKLYAVYRKGAIWSSYPACGEGIEIVAWAADHIVVESFALTGIPQINGVNGTSNGDGTYFLTYDVANNPCKPILISWGGVTKIFQTPLLVDEYTRTSAVTSSVSALTCANCDMVILNGGTAVVDEDKTVRDLSVYPGGRFNLGAGKSFTASRLIMRTEGDELAPVAVISGTFNCSNLYHDRRIDFDRYYWLALPYDVTIDDINFADPVANTKDAKYDTHFYMQFYDGIGRATEKGTSSSYWVHIGDLDDPAFNPSAYQDKTTLKAGRGYLVGLAGKLKNDPGAAGHTYRTLRFPMSVASWTSETGLNKTVAAQGKSCDWPQHIGWNLIGNPFLQNYSAVSASDLACGKLTDSIKDGVWVEPWYTLEEGTKEVPYITIYDPSTDSYTQTRVIGQNIPPFSAAFVQLADGVTGLRFNGTAIGKSNAPARRMGLLNEEDNKSEIEIYALSNTKDKLTIIVDDQYNTEYEVGADLYKFNNNGRVNVYAHHNGTECSFDAISYNDADSIPVGYAQPEAGYMLIKAIETHLTEDVEHVWLIDNETNTWTDLRYNAYEFQTEAGTFNDRLWISIRRTPMITTDIENEYIGSGDSPMKMIYNGQLYIIHDGKIFNAVGNRVK